MLSFLHHRIRPGIFCIILLVLVSSCGKRNHHKPPKIDPGFGVYISAFTSGLISTESGIRIQLAQEYAGANVDGAEVKESYFKFSPGIKGKMYWIDKRTLEFKPENPLPGGTIYDAEFLLYKLIDLPEKFKVFRFQYQTITQNFNVSVEGLEILSGAKPDHYKLNGTLQTADVVDIPSVEKVLEARFNSQDCKISWSHEADRKIHHFSIDSIQRTDKAGKVELLWDGSKIDVEEHAEKTVEIPSLQDFKVIGCRVVNETNPYIILNFSDPVDAEQQLKGIVRLGYGMDVNIDIQNNFVKIYPRYRLTGKQVVYVDAVIKNSNGEPMKRAYSNELNFEENKPAVRFIGKGVILPRSSGLILPFEAMNLSKVDIKIIKIFENNVSQFLQVNDLSGSDELKRVGKPIYREQMNLLTSKITDPGKWNTYFLDLAPLIDNDPGAIYNVTFSFKKEYSLYPCEGENVANSSMEKLPENQDKITEEDKNWEDGEWYYYDYYPDNFNWSERENPCKESYYNQERFVSRNILASDLGLIAKSSGKNQYVVAVTNMITTEPLSGADVELYTYQKQLICKGNTGRDGLLTIVSEQKPFLLIAKKGRQRGYLRLDDGSSLSLSQFDVSGASVEKGLKGFIYGERGVWRPGDTLFLNFILEDKQKVLPPGHPVTLELSDPKGQIVSKLVNNKGVNGFYRFVLTTSDDAPTGNWTAYVKVGGTIFTKNLKIETVKPNRLKINLDLGKKILSVSEPIKGNLKVTWLTGAIAKNLKARVTATFTQTSTTFSTFKDYIFEDPSRSFTGEEQNLFEGKTDETGNASFTHNLAVNSSGSGMLQAGFTVKVFEEGGDISTDYFTLPLSPFNTYIGVKAPRGDKNSGMLETDKPITMDVASVDMNGKPVNVGSLDVEVYKINWRWWWNSNGNDIATYNTDIESTPVYRTHCATIGGKGTFAFAVNYPEWGRYLIRVIDPVGGHSTATTVYIDWPSWQSRDRKQSSESATILTFSTDKKQYKVGEEAIITIPTSGKGRALISLESGTKVVDAYWVEVKEKETVVKIKMTAEMAPNIYAHITLVQPHAQTVNDLPLRMYGVMNLSVYDPASLLEPIITAPAVIKPEQTTVIKVKEKNGKPMTYTLALVDEGLLDLTRFKTPDPWNYFFAREALGIKTWDMFDLVLGAYGGKLGQAFAIGGDKDLKIKNPKKANRFKPMVVFMGPYTIAKGGSANHTIKIPSYIGSVRVMVVAGQDGVYGSAEKTVPVKKPLMVLASLPRVLGPGETVKLPVTVFAMDKNIHDVTVKVSASNFFEISGPLTKTVKFKTTGDQVVDFDLKVKPQTGIAKIDVTVVSGNESAKTSIEIDVRNPNPPVTRFIDKILAPNETWDQSYELIGVSGTRKAVLEVSSLFPVDFERRIQWLIQYPHGCVEQTTSTAFPQLFLSTISDLSKTEVAQIQGNITTAIQKLKGFQLPTGGFAYWPGASQADDWCTNYVGHFIIEAENQGYSLPPGMKDNWVRYQVNMARLWAPDKKPSPDYYSYRDFIQAYRLYTLVLAKVPQLAAMNRLKEQPNISAETRFRLAAAYASAGYKEPARLLINRVIPSTKNLEEMNMTYGSVNRDKAMMIETYCMLGDLKSAFYMVKELSLELNSDRWMSTQSISYSLLAIARYMKSSSTKSTDLPTFAYHSGSNANSNVKLSKSFWRDYLPLNVSKGKINIKNTGHSPLYARLVLSGVPVNNEITPFENNIRMSIVYKDLKGKSLDVRYINQGTDFMAEVTLSNPGKLGIYRNLALSQVFPSGWEILNTRVSGQANIYAKDIPTYQDYRDDRVFTYFDLNPGQVKTFTVLLNASYLGKYYLAGPACEAMYDNRISSAKAGQWVEVVR